MPPQTPPDVLQLLGARQRWISETTSKDSSEVQQCPLLLSAVQRGPPTQSFESLDYVS
jgi:hypothetical protein